MTLAVGLVPLAGLLTAALLLTAMLTALWWFDRCEDEPVRAMALAGAWGASTAVLFCFALQRWPGSTGVAELLLVAAVGQVVRGAGVALLVWRLDGPTEGFLVGAVAGLGWGVGEVAVRAHAGGAGIVATGYGTAVVLLVAAGVGASALATGALGAVLGLGRLARQRRVRALWVSSALPLATLLDAGWRWGSRTVAQPGESWPGGALLLGLVLVTGVLLVWGLLAAEGRVIAEELEEERAWRVVPAWVVQVLPSYRKRVRGDWWPERRNRVVVARLLSRLALRKRATRRLQPAAAELASLEVGRLRSRVRALLLPESSGEE